MHCVSALVATSLLMVGVAVLFTFEPFQEYAEQVIAYIPKDVRSKFDSVLNSVESSLTPNHVMTKDELRLYDGSEGSKGLYLAICGQVFDVSRGERHYGPGKGYGFFAGRDGSKAFISGDFTEKGLTDNLDGLKPSELVDLRDWLKFYQTDYKYIGLLSGHFYDSDGKPTEALHAFHEGVKLGEEEKSRVKADKEMYPACNSEWLQGAGGRVWCSQKSGGIERNWVGVPRKYFKPGSTSTRCACIRTSGPPGDDPTNKHNRGDLDNPNFKEYPGCDSMAPSCPINK